jgi:hypothetical protein
MQKARRDHLKIRVESTKKYRKNQEAQEKRENSSRESVNVPSINDIQNRLNIDSIMLDELTCFTSSSFSFL